MMFAAHLHGGPYDRQTFPIRDPAPELVLQVSEPSPFGGMTAHVTTYRIDGRMAKSADDPDQRPTWCYRHKGDQPSKAQRDE
jgi:hypothetical protein